MVVASAADIKVWTARAMTTVLAETGAEFEKTTGHKLVLKTDIVANFMRRVDAGQQFDLLIGGMPGPDRPLGGDKVVAQSRTPLARSGIGVQVRAGAPKPDVSTVDAFKRTLLEAKSIGYLKVASSGVYLAGLFERLGIAAAVNAKARRPEADIVSKMVAAGEVELGMVIITQIMTTPGVELVGPLPEEIQSYVWFVAGVSTNAKEPEAAMELIRFLKTPKAAAIMKTQGMDPL